MMHRRLPYVSMAAVALVLAGGAVAAGEEARTTPSPNLAPILAPKAETPTAGSPAAPVLPSRDAQAAEWLRRLIEQDLFRYVPREQVRADLTAFYRARNYAPVWSDDGRALPRVKDAIAFLHGVAADGLEPADYPTPYFADANPHRLAADELILSNSVLTFARHARTGRVHFARVDDAIHYGEKAPSAADVFGLIAASGDTRAALDSFNPQAPGYKALKAALAAETRTEDDDGKRRGRRAHTSRTDTILANMERWRWLPHDLGAAHVMVNVADYTLQVFHDGRPVWATAVVVGRRGKSATPLLSAPLKFITLNPTWDVKESVVRDSYLAALDEPDAVGPDGRRPASGGATGHVRFDFPNRFLVYQRDAADGQFARRDRLHGDATILVQDAERYAQILLSISRPGEGFTFASMRALYRDEEHATEIAKPILVHLSYQTAFVDESGEVQLRPDIYGYDREIARLLRDERTVADMPPDRSNASNELLNAALPVADDLNEREDVFGAGAPEPEPPVRRFAPAPTWRRHDLQQ